MDSHRHIRVDRQGDVFCVRLRHTRLEEREIAQVGQELLSLVTQDGCRKLAMSLGPEPPDCLYSVFLAKLVSLRNALRNQEGQFVLCEVGPIAYSVFEATRLDKEFTFTPDFATACAYLQKFD